MSFKSTLLLVDYMATINNFVASVCDSEAVGEAQSNPGRVGGSVLNHF